MKSTHHYNLEKRKGRHKRGCEHFGKNRAYIFQPKGEVGTLTLRSLHLPLYELLDEYSGFNTISDTLV